MPLARHRLRALRRRFSGSGRPRAATAASLASSPLLALARQRALPARTAGSNSNRALKDAARIFLVAEPSRDWPRSRPNAAQ
jgi:hypothetical protein